MPRLLASADAAASDGELLGRLQAGDATALGNLYDRHAGHALAVAVRVLGSREEAEDVVQEVFWRLWTGRARYDPLRGRFRSWLSAISRNRAIDVVRRSARRSALRAENPTVLAVEGGSPEEDAQAAERRRHVEAALAELPAELRELVELAFYRGLTHREIAEQLDQPLGTVKSRLHRSVQLMRSTLGPAGSAP